jgi:Lamin Tail Domain
MRGGIRFQVATLVATASLSGCFFFTDFDGLTTGGAAGAAGAAATGGSGGVAGMGGSDGGGIGVGGQATGGTGGAPQVPMVVLNELVADPLPGQEDWIELYNAGGSSADISGWFFTDGSNQFTFPSSTVIPVDGYLVLDRNGPGSFTFGFSKDGETISLHDSKGTSVDTTTWVAGQAEQPDAWGRIPNGSGAFQTVTPTKGTANQ